VIELASKLSEINPKGLNRFCFASGGSVPVKQTRDSSADALEKELLIRPLGTVLYLWHPFVNSQGEMNGMPVILRDSLKEALG